MRKIGHLAKTFSLSALLLACSDSTLSLKPSSAISDLSLEKKIESVADMLLIPKNIQEENTWYPEINVPETSLVFHAHAGNIAREGYVYFADSREFISSEGTPRLGINADNPEGTGDDLTIARQRLIYHISYLIKDDNTLKYRILDVFPYRAARRGFGFTLGSHQTPTGLFLLTPQSISYHPFGYINQEKGITGAILDMWNILDSQGNPIYRETEGANDPHNRMIVPHAYLGQNHQLYQDAGSMGCPHISSENIQNMFNFVYANPNSYIYIAGSCDEDLPALERKLIVYNQNLPEHQEK